MPFAQEEVVALRGDVSGDPRRSNRIRTRSVGLKIFMAEESTFVRQNTPLSYTDPQQTLSDSQEEITTGSLGKHENHMRQIPPNSHDSVINRAINTLSDVPRLVESQKTDTDLSQVRVLYSVRRKHLGPRVRQNATS